jgi:anti-anti-sigma factor
VEKSNIRTKVVVGREGIRPKSQGLAVLPGDLPHPDCQARTDAVEEASFTLSVGGQILHHAVPWLRQYLEDQVRHFAPRVARLDFAKVRFIDSQGLAMLIALNRFCLSQRSRMILCQPTKEMRGLFELTQLDKIIHIE